MALLLTIMSDHEDMNKVSETKVNSHENRQNEFPFRVRMIVPPDLHQIQSRATQVWNCDEIGFDPNGKWRKVVCTYELFQGERMRKAQTVERAPLWLVHLTCIPQDLMGNASFLPSLFIKPISTPNISIATFHLTRQVRHTPYGYTDRDGWIKATTQFSNRCGASPVNNQILFFDWKR